MRPSSTWFPTSLAARAAWFQNFATQFAAYFGTLGFVAADLTAVQSDNEDFQWIATTTVSVDQFRAAVVQYRLNLTEGDIGDPQPVFPSESFSGPPNDSPAGMFERLDKLRNRILAAPAYTPEIGTALGIVGSTGSPTNPGLVKPAIELSSSVHGFLFSCVVSGREDSDQWQCWAKPASGGSFALVGTATGKSSDFTYDPGGSSTPVQLEVYVQLRKANANYGQPSDISLVTVNP